MIDYSARAGTRVGHKSKSEWAWAGEISSKQKKDIRAKQGLECLCLGKQEDELTAVQDAISTIKRTLPELFNRMYLNPVETLELYVKSAIIIKSKKEEQSEEK